MGEIKNYEVVPNGFWGKPEVRQGITKEDISEAVEYVFREPQERQFTMYTRPEGASAFDAAIQNLISEEVWTATRPILVGEPEPVMEYPERPTAQSYLFEFLDATLDSPTVTSLNALLETPNVPRIRQGTTDVQEVHTQRFRNGDITLVEYLDLISEQ